MILFLLLTVIPLVNFIITVYNFFTHPEFSSKMYFGRKVTVSVLIPARNEERNIRECLRGILNQSYENYEVIVMDDFSNDNTFAIAEEIAQKDSRVKVLRGTVLPAGWTGKNWTCMQLAEKSGGEYILFIDADVCLENKTLETSLFYMQEKNPDLLTVFPLQITKSFGEKLTVPLFNWILLSFLPVKKVFENKSKYYTAAIGQFMMWKRDSYFSSGGHRAVKDKVVEDIELAKHLKAQGFSIYPALSDGTVKCRMYGSFRESITGFSKNYFPASSGSAFRFLLIISAITFSYILPFVLIFFSNLYLITLVIIILQRILVLSISRKNIFCSFLFPFQMIIFLYTGIRSVMHTKSGKATWKDRKV